MDWLAEMRPMVIGGLLVVGVGACARWLRSIDLHMATTSQALKTHFEVVHPAVDKRIEQLEDRLANTHTPKNFG